MLSGPRMKASGLSRAQARAATATSASWRRVVPNSCMWREAASAYADTGMAGSYGASYGCGSRKRRLATLSRRPKVALRWALP